MGYNDFPDTAGFIQITNTDELTPLGKIQVDEALELTDIVLHAQKVGIHSSETLRLELHNLELVDSKVYESATYTYTDFEVTASHWAGTMRFSFVNSPLNPNIEYHVKIVAENYVYEDDSRYIAFQTDWPEEINNNEIPSNPGAAMGIYGFTE